MELPAQFTVEEVIGRVKPELEQATKWVTEAQKEFEEYYTPEYKLTWFGWYKKIDKSDNWRLYHYSVDNLTRLKSVKSKLEETLFALSKFPLDAKVKLSVEEVNELFSKEKEHKDED